MPKRRLYFIFALSLLAGVVVALFNRDREPVYEGKRLSEWVDKTDWGSTGGFPRQLSVMPKKAVDAIRQTGTNAFPYLLQWIGYEPPPWKTNSIAFLNRAFHATLVDRRDIRAEGAFRGFVVLEEKAEGAVPGLASLMNDSRNPKRARRAAAALYALSPKLLAAGIVLMTNNSATMRRDAVSRVFAYKTPLDPAVPVLIHCLQDGDVEVAKLAAQALAFARLAPSVVVPALEQSLNDKRPEVRRAAIYALERFNTSARSAVPALFALRYTDPDLSVRFAVTGALQAIDPLALEHPNEATK